MRPINLFILCAMFCFCLWMIVGSTSWVEVNEKSTCFKERGGQVVYESPADKKDNNTKGGEADAVRQQEEEKGAKEVSKP